MFQIVKQVAVVLNGVTRRKFAYFASSACFPKISETTQRSYSHDSSKEPWLFTDHHPPSQPEFREIAIPVPYGHIAAKVWGRNNGDPVLAFHGWLDNCGTFDKLIPLLSRSLYVVAIDAPGHGLSSHRPPGCHYKDIDLLIDFKKVFDYMGWEKCNIIGHSLGGGLALMFASLFPDKVNKLVVLDIIKPSSRPVEFFPRETIDAITEHMKIEEKLLLPTPVYTKEDAVARLIKGMFNEVTQESAEILIRRGSKLSESGDGHIFTRDLRCRTLERFSRVSHDTLIHFMSSLKCELLIILANNTHKNYKTSTPEITDKFIEVYRTHCKTFQLKTVEGNHFVHINNPERVAPLIDEFFAEVLDFNMKPSSIPE